MTIGETISRARKDEGLTQQSLSIMTGLTERMINYIEHGKKKPSLKSLNKIADALNKTLIVTYSPQQKENIVLFKLRETIRVRSFDERLKQLDERLYSDCLRLCNYNADMAKDLKQETMCQALMFHYRYNEKCQLYTWLFSMAKNIHCQTRKQNKHLVFVEQYIEDTIAVEDVDIFYENKNLFAYIRKLSPKRMQLYKLRLLNTSYAEIGRQLGVTSAYAKARFWQIKKEIQDRL
jgi:RNA polymerase sigma factor (sigma-70 family)